MPDNEKDPLDDQYKFLADLIERQRLDKAHAIEVGERLEQLYTNGTFTFLDQEIFEPVRQEMFAAIETGKLDPNDGPMMTRWAGLVKGIREIKSLWEKKIKTARLDRAQLLESAPPNGGDPQ